MVHRRGRESATAPMASRFDKGGAGNKGHFVQLRGRCGLGSGRRGRWHLWVWRGGEVCSPHVPAACLSHVPLVARLSKTCWRSSMGLRSTRPISSARRGKLRLLRIAVSSQSRENGGRFVLRVGRLHTKSRFRIASVRARTVRAIISDFDMVVVLALPCVSEMAHVSESATHSPSLGWSLCGRRDHQISTRQFLTQQYRDIQRGLRRIAKQYK